MYIPVRYSITAAWYTGAAALTRHFGNDFFKYLCILPTGKRTPALADRDIDFCRFFPPLPDMMSQIHCQYAK